MLLLMHQAVGADMVHARWFVGAGGEEGGIGNHPRLQREQIAEDARQRDDDVDARAAKLAQGDQFGPRKTTIAVEARGSADQRKDLGNLRAFALQIVRTPQHHRQRGRRAAGVGRVARDERFGLCGAVLHRKAAGDAERVKAVDVAASGQDFGVADQIAARRRANIMCIERSDDAAELVFVDAV